MNIEQWPSIFRSVRESIGSAHKAAEEMTHWIDQNVVGDDVFPRQWPEDLEKSFQALYDALSFLKKTVAEMDNDFTTMILRILGGKRPTREEFHLTMALDPKSLNFTNKSVG